MELSKHGSDAAARDLLATHGTHPESDSCSEGIVSVSLPWVGDGDHVVCHHLLLVPHHQFVHVLLQVAHLEAGHPAYHLNMAGS